MTLLELCKGLENQTININENGHDPFYGWGPVNMIEQLKRKLDYYDKHNWKNGNQEISTKEHILEVENFNCSKCGKKVVWLYNETLNEIKCIEAEHISDGEISSWHYIYKDNRCVEEHELPFSFEFEVKDTLLFTNFFRGWEEEEKEEKKKHKYDWFGLNYLFGRKNLASFFASLNVGYQQTTNTSVYIFINKDKTELVIIEGSYYHDDENDEEFSAEEELPKLGYKFLGSVSCDMWRYMFMNQCDLRECDKKFETVKAKIKKGKYKVFNYFDSSEADTHKIDKFSVASSIKLIE